MNTSDIVEIRCGIDKITIEKFVEYMKGIDVSLLFDRITHQRCLEIYMRLLDCIDQTNLKKRITNPEAHSSLLPDRENRHIDTD